MRQTCKVKFFSQTIEFGFITPDVGGSSIIVYVAAVKGFDIGQLSDGAGHIILCRAEKARQRTKGN